METKIKIQRLWQYLEVQDNEVLIVRTFRTTDNQEVYIVVKSNKNSVLEIKIEQSMPDITELEGFKLVQQRDFYGRFVIPSVDDLVKDKIYDY